MRALQSTTKMIQDTMQPEDDCDSDELGDEWEWVGKGKAGLLLQGKKWGEYGGGGKIVGEEIVKAFVQEGHHRQLKDCNY